MRYWLVHCNVFIDYLCRVKAPGLSDRKLPHMGLILGNLRSLNRESFRSAGNSKEKLYCVLMLFLMFCCGVIHAQETNPNASGSLIVTYQTGSQGERLDRIRFWLKKSDGQFHQMFPKGDAFVDDPTSKTRMVVIENLLPGKYIIEFVVPNRDNHFENVPKKEILISKGSAVKVDQSIKPRNAAFKGLTDHTEIAQADRSNGTVTVITNLPNARWVIYHNNVSVYQGKGSEYDITLPSGSYYTIRAEEMEGYNTLVQPQQDFSIQADKPSTAEISYERKHGAIEVYTMMPEGEVVEILVTSSPEGAINMRNFVRAEGGRLFWRSPDIPTGNYVITYRPANPRYLPKAPETITVFQGQNVLLTPEFIEGHNLTVNANIPEASYTLKDAKGNIVGVGNGRTYEFTGLAPGEYILSYSVNGKTYYAAPRDERVVMNAFDNQTHSVQFPLGGKLIVNSNDLPGLLRIESISRTINPISEEINGNAAYQLPAGHYRVSFNPSKGGTSQTIEVRVDPQQTREVKMTAAETPGASKIHDTVTVLLNTDGTFHIREVSADPNVPGKDLGVFNGKRNVIPVSPHVKYEVVFDPISSYKAPESQTFELATGQNKTINATYVPYNEVVAVTEGDSILGPQDSGQKVHLKTFSIGKFEVTNAQFTHWLNEANKSGKIKFLVNGANSGQVFDSKNHLLCKTYISEPNSAINVITNPDQSLSFVPVPGKDNHPVIFVTWNGAMAYCQDNQGRLPNEAEWEKAAGMALTDKGQPLRKFLFGFSQNEIDRTWANYKITDSPIQNFKVLTTPVGFYNGINKLPLQSNDKQQLTTHDAVSPVGAYDMSGNVWEWVSDWYSAAYPKVAVGGPNTGSQKVAKGGCYDSLADGVRVTERLPLAPNWCDAYTGFRFAR